MRHVRSFLDTYGLPHRVPVVIRIVIMWALFVVIGFCIWYFPPKTPALVAIGVVYVLVAGVLGLWRLSTSRELSRPPGRPPQPPPSTTPPSTS